jgi:hypothetical protein
LGAGALAVAAVSLFEHPARRAATAMAAIGSGFIGGFMAFATGGSIGAIAPARDGS